MFDVRYERPWVDANDDYQELDVPIQGGSMITGTYNNELLYSYGEGATQGGAQSGQTIVRGGSFGGLFQWGGDGSETGVGIDYDGVFIDSPKIKPGDIEIVNPANAANYDGYIVAIYLKCIGDTTLKK